MARIFAGPSWRAKVACELAARSNTKQEIKTNMPNHYQQKPSALQTNWQNVLAIANKQMH